jgi:hypothetical protein
MLKEEYIVPPPASVHSCATTEPSSSSNEPPTVSRTKSEDLSEELGLSREEARQLLHEDDQVREGSQRPSATPQSYPVSTGWLGSLQSAAQSALQSAASHMTSYNTPQVEECRAPQALSRLECIVQLRRDFQQLFLQQTFDHLTDMSFTCVDSTQPVRVHKAIVSVRMRDYMTALLDFSFDGQEHTDEVKIETQLTRSVCLILVNYLYSGTLASHVTCGTEEDGAPPPYSFTSEEEAVDLIEVLAAADQYMLPRLIQLAESEIEKQIDVDNVAYVLKAATDSANAPQLRDLAEYLVLRDWSKVSQTQAWCDVAFESTPFMPDNAACAVDGANPGRRISRSWSLKAERLETDLGRSIADAADPDRRRRVRQQEAHVRGCCIA